MLNIDMFVSILHNISSMQRMLILIKKPIPLLDMSSSTQTMQQTWWPMLGTAIVTGSYWQELLEQFSHIW